MITTDLPPLAGVRVNAWRRGRAARDGRRAHAAPVIGFAAVAAVHAAHNDERGGGRAESRVTDATVPGCC
jgi:hypothetical protein